jgi:hypothetical protein
MLSWLELKNFVWFVYYYLLSVKEAWRDVNAFDTSVLGPSSVILYTTTNKYTEV